LIQYVAYIDDSGNSPSEEWFVLAGWVAPFPDWFYFSKDWVKRLKETPAIDYFKHSEAMGKAD
jgi:hypothetical protein